MASSTHLLGTHETNMFYRVRGPRHVIGIAEAPHVDVHGGGGFVRIGIMDQKNLQLIGQLDDAVRTVVQQWLLQCVRDMLNDRAGTQRFTTHGLLCPGAMKICLVLAEGANKRQRKGRWPRRVHWTRSSGRGGKRGTLGKAALPHHLGCFLCHDLNSFS